MKLLAITTCIAAFAASVQAGSLRRRVRKSLEVESNNNNNNNNNELINAVSGFIDLNQDGAFLQDETNRFLQMSMSMPMPTPAPTIDERGPQIEAKCSQSASERSRDILSILTPLSEEDSLLIGNTLQFQARMWVDEMDPAIICASDADRIMQRYRAALVYYSLGGDSSWTTSTGWLTGSNECEWFGLECDGYTAATDSDSYVPITAVRLDQNGLTGELPAELFGLPSLQRMIMEGNSISGSIPEGISQATQLATLDLDFNSLSGELPAGLYTLPAITNIDLNNNNLTGGISASVSNLSTLNVLNLEDNDLSGAIPILSLLQLEELAAFSIQNNGLTGTLEPICNVLDDRRQSFPSYGGFLFADCGGDAPPVACSCCTCLA
ncbi:unnamed protein product [Cylindrotheca closterium]|uniref:Leucine-rich repeat-containing N-terminal plant-type domain-containing protein n=1 Tax=Cylindrotheca closterium TaxID=2856 RepID=A0AAD2JHQ3_9STRA|nr:unnamed protein product [Cylindrotheca closterium]